MSTPVTGQPRPISLADERIVLEVRELPNDGRCERDLIGNDELCVCDQHGWSSRYTQGATVRVHQAKLRAVNSLSERVGFWGAPRRSRCAADEALPTSGLHRPALWRKHMVGAIMMPRSWTHKRRRYHRARHRSRWPRRFYKARSCGVSGRAQSTGAARTVCFRPRRRLARRTSDSALSNCSPRWRRRSSKTPA